MLTQEEQRYTKYLAGQGDNWETVLRPASLPSPFLPSSDVAVMKFYAPHIIHFTETLIHDNVEIAFGLLDVLKERGIEALVCGTVLALREDDPDRDYHIRHPRSSLIITNPNAFVLVARQYALSRDELFSSNAFSLGFETYKMYCCKSPPGYVDISLYADLETLSSTYAVDGIKIITKQDIEQRELDRRKLFYALREGNVGMLAEIVQTGIAPELSLSSQAATEVASILVLSTDSDRRNTEEH